MDVFFLVLLAVILGIIAGWLARAKLHPAAPAKKPRKPRKSKDATQEQSPAA